MSARLALFDGTGLLVRCARAGARSGMASGQVPTGPLHIFTGALCRRLRESAPTHVLVAWDGGRGREARQRLWPGYKAAREPLAPGLQAALAQEACYAVGVLQACEESAEADDIIAAAHALAQRALPGVETVIYSDDADLRQLVGEKTVQALLASGEEWDLSRVRAEYHCEPGQLPMVRALSGDRSDGIPGITQVGFRKAVKMLEASGWDFGSALRAKGLGEEQIMDVKRFRAIIDLRGSNSLWLPGHEEAAGEHSFGPAAEWDPAGSRERLRTFLARYELAGLSRMLREERLLPAS